MMRGRSKLSSYFPHRHVLLSFAMNILLKCPRRRARALAAGSLCTQSFYCIRARGLERKRGRDVARNQQVGICILIGGSKVAYGQRIAGKVSRKACRRIHYE